MELSNWLETKLQQDIWIKKYKDENETLDDFFDRVSNGNENIKNHIINKRFLFGGRILANRGLQNKNKKVTFSNCFVIKSPSDNIESIFDCAKKMARTYSYGGGVGVDLSKLSPRGAKINNAAKETSGAVSFMDLYSLTTGIICQNGRRGALMITLNCNHPDLEEFIDIKTNETSITKANISIKITNDFMKAVLNNKEFLLSFTREETGEIITKNIDAKRIFDKIILNNYNWAEPGFLMWDRINEWNLLSDDKEFEYESVNPCAK